MRTRVIYFLAVMLTFKARAGLCLTAADSAWNPIFSIAQSARQPSDAPFDERYQYQLASNNAVAIQPPPTDAATDPSKQNHSVQMGVLSSARPDPNGYLKVVPVPEPVLLALAIFAIMLLALAGLEWAWRGEKSGNNPPGANGEDSGCPTWIRTRTKASKGPCATVTPSDSGWIK